MLSDFYNKSIRYLKIHLNYKQLREDVSLLITKVGKFKDNIEKNIPYWNMREREHPAFARFGMVILLLLVAIGSKYLVNIFIIYRLPFMLLYSVVVISSWYGGLRPGLMAVMLTSTLAYFLYLPSTQVYDGFSIAVTLILFSLEGILIVGLSHSMHTALQTLERNKVTSQYFASIAQHISDAVISTDMNFNIQSWNKGAEELYYWKRNEILGKQLYEVIPTIYQTQLKGDMKDVLIQEDHWKGEVTHKRKNGGRVYVLTSMSIIRDDQDKPLGIVAVNRDISDRKKLEQGKDDFIALASHELKTPLTSIKLYADILKQRFEKNDDRKSMEYLSKINTQMSKLLELVSHLLDVSKVQSGKLQYHLEDVSIDNFISQVVHEVQEVTQSHRITIKDRVPATVKIDKDRMRQVIVNILTNAVKYSAKADRIVVGMKKEKPNVVISIQDYGIGIPKELHQKIFERFYQVTDSKGYTYSGMGLGLYIAHEIIIKHGGKLWVESEVGIGSTFFFTLPIVK